MKESRILVGLDIGTTKVCTVIGELLADGSLDIIGEGTVVSDVMKKGAVVNLERTTAVIRQSMTQAERVAGVSVQDVYFSISGPHIKALTSHGLAAIRRNQEIRKEDVERAIENAQAVDLGSSVEIIHTQPQEFRIDGQEGIKNPVGMQGVRLEVDVHIVASASGPLANLKRCVSEAGVNPQSVVLQAYASGLAVLEGHELDTTTIVIDIGGSGTDVGVFRRGNLCHSAVVPIGSDHITNDLAQLFKITPEEATRIKKQHGCAVPELADPEVNLEINQGSNTLTISAFDLSRVIRPRVLEILDLARKDIDDSLGPMELLASGVVLSGGGSLLRGMIELAQDRFRLPVRIGLPQGLGGLHDVVESPVFSTAVGLLRFAALQNPIHIPSVSPAGRKHMPKAQEMPQLMQEVPVPDDIPAVPTKPPKATSVNNLSTRAVQDTQQKGFMEKVKEFFKDFF